MDRTAVMDGPRAGAEVLPHGWTAAGVQTVACQAARLSRWSVPALTEKVDIARFAVVEHLYTCPGHGAGCDLIRVGVAAIERHVGMDETFYGLILRRGIPGAAMPRYHRYWTPPPPPWLEDGVVEALALWQIWDRLAAVDRNAILALATHGSYDCAAAALGLTHQSFKDRIWRARRNFLRLWHEGEAPSRIWGLDRPKVNSRPGRTTSVRVTLRRRSRNQAARAARHPARPAEPNRPRVA
jgi:hypothetical protein